MIRKIKNKKIITTNKFRIKRKIKKKYIIKVKSYRPRVKVRGNSDSKNKNKLNLQQNNISKKFDISKKLNKLKKQPVQKFIRAKVTPGAKMTSCKGFFV